MATARAQAKGGVSGLHIWLIVFVALCLTSTVLLVLLYTDQKDLVSRNDDLQRQLDTATKNLRSAESGRSAIAEAATGDPSDTPAVVQAKLDDLYARIGGDERLRDVPGFDSASASDALGSLYDLLRAQTEKLAAALERNEDLAAEFEQLSASNTSQKAAFDDQIAALEQQVNELKASWEEYGRSRDREVDQLDEKLAGIDARYNTDIQNQRNETKRAVTERDELQSRYDELTERLGELQIRPQELITARRADGHVVTAKPGEEIVYIDLGRDAGVVLGLQFAVYSAAAGIPADGRAKARIEVVNIFESASECRIVEVHAREPILEKDAVANPVFDRDRTLQFLVLGRFDVDGDGAPDSEGDRQIESLVTNWGGDVATDLSARVDFLVLGDAPPKPFTVGDPSPEAAARADAAQRVYDRYTETLSAARALSIPILTQSVFLHFLGYAR